jgi:hypothetical protein
MGRPARHGETEKPTLASRSYQRSHPPIVEAGLQSPAQASLRRGRCPGAGSGTLRGGHLQDRIGEDDQRPGPGRHPAKAALLWDTEYHMRSFSVEYPSLRTSFVHLPG